MDCGVVVGKLLFLGLFFFAAFGYAHIEAPAGSCRSELEGMLQTVPSVGDGRYPVRVWSPMPHVHFLLFNSQTEVAKTFLRFQEHFESPKYRQQIFSIPEYVAYYRREFGKGKFTYFEDWAGFNFPSSNLKPFYEGKFDPLTPREKWFVDLTKTFGKNFYVVATFLPAGESPGQHMIDTLRHELAHSLYFLNPDYKKKVDEILATVDLKPIYKILEGAGGYHPSVFDDECHAYLMNDGGYLKRRGLDLAPYQESMKALNALFEIEFAAWRQSGGGAS